MQTIAIINATGINEYALAAFAGGPSSLQRVLALAEGLAIPGGILVLAQADATFTLPAEAAVVRRGQWSMKAVLEEALAFSRGLPQADSVLYLQADSPFTDPALAGRLLALHDRYRAEYTYADGYPPGFSPEILSTRALPNLRELAAKNDRSVDRDALFAVLQKDINAYDIETELSPVDLRTLRFSPVCDTRRNALAAERLWAEGVRSADDAIRLLPERPDLLRTVPAFLWVQVSGPCAQSCSYCPYPLMAGDPRQATGFMPADRFGDLMAQAEALCDDLVVDLSLWGEPSLHPQIAELAEAVLARPRFSLIMETSGIGWRPGVAERIARLAGSRAHWIVSLDDADEAGYRSLRGEGKDEAEAFAERMLADFAPQVHIQAVRMRQNEERLEAFYRAWKKRSEHVIVQKYDSFASCLPDRTVAELSPLERYPCRHLARDMAVLMDGTVPACKHSLVPDPAGSGRLVYHGAMGNAFEGGLAAAWDEAGQWYRRHAERDYPTPCGKCDEYHTFNA